MGVTKPRLKCWYANTVIRRRPGGNSKQAVVLYGPRIEDGGPYFTPRSKGACKEWASSLGYVAEFMPTEADESFQC